MPKSTFTGANKVLVQMLSAKRKDSGLTQTQLGQKIGKDQSFISLIEGAQRRVDVVEFVAICRATGTDPVQLFAEFAALVPNDLEI